MYDVYLEKNAENDLRDLPKEIFPKIVRLIRLLQNDPRPQGCRKMADKKNFWRIRYSRYRILYEIDDEKREVRIRKIKHRKESYR